MNHQGDIRLVDFNPFCLRTDPLLFSWEELSSGRVTSDEGGAPEVTTVMRVVQSGASIRSHDLQEYRYPRDALDLARGEDVHKLIDILSLVGKRVSTFMRTFSLSLSLSLSGHAEK